MAFRFRKFPVYKEAVQFRKEIKDLAENFPKKEIYILFSQIVRAADSIVLNIAEGADRGTDLDFARFLNNSLTSVNEVVGCLDLALIDKYITQELHEKFLQKAEELANQLTAFRKSLLDKPTK